MNKTNSLLPFFLVVICLLILGPRGVTSQTVSPNVAQIDPCLIQPPPPQCTTIPSPDPRKGVSMGAVIRAEEFEKQDQDIRGPNPAFYPNAKPNIEILRESGTGWVRLWVDWPVLQPTHDFSFGDLYNDPRTQPFIENLDAQIVFARQNNLRVILVVNHRFPLWSNGTPDQQCPSSCDLETDPDRKQECQKQCGTINDPNWIRLKLDKPRNPFGRVPADLGVDSPWGKWINFLVRRYGYSAETELSQHYVDYLEVVNEPNLTMWPQWRDDRVGNRDNIKDRLLIANNVAQMFRTAQEIVSRRNGEPGVINSQHSTTIKLAGPATSDLRDPKTDAPGDPLEKKDKRKSIRVVQTGYDTFTRELLVQLRNVPRFNPKSYFTWSQHNYGDIEKSRRESPVFDAKVQTLEDPQGKTNAVAWVRELLRVGTGKGRANRWTGWPDAEHPGLIVTEGGARLSAVGSEAEQAKLVVDNFNLMLSDNGRLRAGIGLFTQYLTYSDVCFDSGLFYFIDSQPTRPRDLDCGRRFGFTGGGFRPPRMVYERWKTLKSTFKNPVP